MQKQYIVTREQLVAFAKSIHWLPDADDEILKTAAEYGFREIPSGAQFLSSKQIEVIRAEARLDKY